MRDATRAYAAELPEFLLSGSALAVQRHPARAGYGMRTARGRQREPRLIDLHPPHADMRADVLAGLAMMSKQLSPKYFYDKEGSTIFEQITQLDEYYLTRTEAGIMRDHLPEMAERIGPGVAVIEFGSGTGAKIQQLLGFLSQPVAAVTVEISRAHLETAAYRQAQRFPHLEIIAVCADFTRPFQLPAINGARRNLVFFPGSTIGNFTLEHAGQLLAVMRSVAGSAGAVLIGVDLVKDTASLEAAYNDRKGVTATFNLNLLQRINRELGGNFDTSAFRHQAIYNRTAQRIEMYLVSQSHQSVRLGDASFDFSPGERILTEYSHKYEVEGFSALASSAGLHTAQVWTDADDRFAVFLLEPDTG